VAPARPGLGTETLQQLTDLQRQVGERVAPLSERERQRSRRHARRLAKRTAAAIAPLLLVVAVAVDVGGSRDWIGDRWSDLNRQTTPQQEPAAGTTGR
jgi:hypothetical protein